MDLKNARHEEHNIGTKRFFVILQYKLHVSILNTSSSNSSYTEHIPLCYGSIKKIIKF